MEKKVYIKKAGGQSQLFSEKKLKDSLKRSGASQHVVDTIVEHIKRELKDGMTTKKIYNHAFALLKKGRKDVAVRYSLRQAVMTLGPDGFPFEKFIGEILKTQGFEVKVGVILYGFCVTHEVDILANNGDKHIFVEAKFHNQLGIKTDLKVALYVKARFNDLKKNHRKKELMSPIIHEGWLVTNTKLTSKACQYGRCSGLKLIGWNYPRKGNLQDMILESGIHPVSCLTTLSQKNKAALFERNVVLCRDVEKNINILTEIGLSEKKIREVVNEISLLCRKDKN